MLPKLIGYFLFGIIVTYSGELFATDTQQRLSKDIKAGTPVVIHVVVALADNANQWIVPVPSALGNGQDTKSNLYWGALYGLKTFMRQRGGWRLLKSSPLSDKRILERIILTKTFMRQGRKVAVYLVADAWDGRFIMDSIKRYLQYNAGQESVRINLKDVVLHAGAQSQLIAYIGHNALMDYAGIKDKLVSNPTPASVNPDNDAIVLACSSADYFRARLQQLRAHPLLLTTGSMAPEAYTLNAAITAWIKGDSDQQIRKASAKSYHHYQKTGLRAAERLFGVRGP